MLIKRPEPGAVRSSEITPESAYLNRRAFIAAAGGAGAAAAGLMLAGCGSDTRVWAEADGAVEQDLPDRLNSWEDITSYNNYYEFGTGKEDPARNAQRFRTRPWTVRVDGLVRNPRDWQLEDLLRAHAVEDRVVRLRCVEGWSMVIPFQGIPLGDMIARFEPLPSARYVAFTTIMAPDQMPGQRRPILRWPYVEGLRLDEATHPLTLMATGLYGRPMPNQNGAPFRLVVPWKYGFKWIKAIVRIEFTETEPPTTWNIETPNEYGFYANVNPTVDHPRWSQATERRIGEFRRRRTLMFNGYADQVAHLYAGMDLRRFY